AAAATEGAVARAQKSAQQGGVQPMPSHTTGQAALGAQVANAEMVATTADCLAAPVFSMADALHAVLARYLHSLAAGQVAQGPRNEDRRGQVAWQTTHAAVRRRCHCGNQTRQPALQRRAHRPDDLWRRAEISHQQTDGGADS